MRTIWRRLESLLAVALLISGCAGPTFSPDAAPEYLVRHNQTPFFRLGPQQAGAPDAWLAENDRVRMLRREFGYSLMLLPGGERGYVANDDLAAAPEIPNEPEPEPPPLPPKKDSPASRPDLNAMPADAPPAG